MKSLIFYCWFLLNLVCTTISYSQTEFWQEKSNGLYGGSVPHMAINASGHIFAGTSSAGMFRSADNGESWTQINNGLEGQAVAALAISTSGDIFVGIEGSSGAGIYRSTNNGESWAKKIDQGNITSIVFNSSGDIFYSCKARFGEIVKSSDNGENWTLFASLGVDLEDLDYSISDMVINASDEIFIIFNHYYFSTGITGNAILRSTDNGATWVDVNYSGPYLTSLAVSPSGDIYATTQWSSRGGIYKSTDNGETWARLENSPRGVKINSLAFTSSGVILAGVQYGEAGVYFSRDNGNTWTSSSSCNTGVLSFAVNASGHVFAGTDGVGILRNTDNFESWEPVNSGLCAVNIYSLAIDSSDIIYAGTVGYRYSAGSGVFRSEDHGESWVNTGLADEAGVSIAVNSSGHVFAGFNEIYRSTDQGEHWAKVTDEFVNVNDLAINSSGDIFGITHDIIFRSTDNGESWTQVYTVPETRSWWNYCITISPSDEIFVGAMGGVLRSTDNGESWTPINNGSISLWIPNENFDLVPRQFVSFNSTGDSILVNVEISDLFIKSIVINSLGHIFAGTRGVYGKYIWEDGSEFTRHARGGVVFRSTDNGESWTPCGNGLPERYRNVDSTGNGIVSLAVNSSGTIFAGTQSHGIFMSADNGESWQPINSGLKRTEVWALAVDSHDYLYAGGSALGVGQPEGEENGMWAGKAAGGGVFRSVFPTTDYSYTDVTASIPLSFTLHQNYPNPFNSFTTISYEIPVRTHVSFKIYNILGQEVITLLSGYRDSGTHSIRWDASKCSDGVYLAVMKAGNIKKIKRMVLIK